MNVNNNNKFYDLRLREDLSNEKDNCNMHIILESATKMDNKKLY